MILRLLVPLLLLTACATSSSTTRKPNWVCEVPAFGALLLDVPRLDAVELELVSLEGGVRVRGSSTVIRLRCMQVVDVQVDAAVSAPLPSTP